MAGKKPGPKKGDPRVKEAGRKGGMMMRDRYGPEFFREIGRKGGVATRQIHGNEFYSKIGRAGGNRSGGGRGAAAMAEVGLVVRLHRRQDGLRLGEGEIVHVHPDGTVNVRVQWDSGGTASVLGKVASRTHPEELQHDWFYWEPVAPPEPTLPEPAPKRAPRSAPRPAPRPERAPSSDRLSGPSAEAVHRAIAELWTAGGGEPVDWLDISRRLGCGVSSVFHAAEELQGAGVINYQRRGVELLVAPQAAP